MLPVPVAVMRDRRRGQRDCASADTLAAAHVILPTVLTLLACTLLGTVGWYFLGAALAFNCGMSELDCGTTAKLWLAADGIGYGGWPRRQSSCWSQAARGRGSGALPRSRAGPAAGRRRVVLSRRAPGMTPPRERGLVVWVGACRGREPLVVHCRRDPGGSRIALRRDDGHVP